MIRQRDVERLEFAVLRLLAELAGSWNVRGLCNCGARIGVAERLADPPCPLCARLLEVHAGIRKPAQPGKMHYWPAAVDALGVATVGREVFHAFGWLELGFPSKATSGTE